MVKVEVENMLTNIAYKIIDIKKDQALTII